MYSSNRYTTPELCSYGNDLSKKWFVYFDFTDELSQKTLRKQFRGHINKCKSVADRLKAGQVVKKYWEEQLKHGWSPFLNSGIHELGKMRLNESLDWALEKCEVAGKTKSGYTLAVKYFKKAAIALHLDKSLIAGIKKQHVMLLLDQVKKTRTWSNHAYNKNTNYISGVFSRLVKYEIIEHNPAHNIPQLSVAETNMYETITEAEKIVIRDSLTKVHPSFFTYLMLVYHCGIRPVECLALKISDVYIDKKLIIIKPVLLAENSKTKSIRMVPLNKHMAELLRHHIEDHEKHLYIFGSPNGPGGNKGSQKGGIYGAMRNDYFLPSEYQVKRDTATRLWNTLVIVGLGIKKYMYALKHTGGDDKILAGISIDALKEMYGHSSKFMTEKYAKKIKGVYRDQIIENSPDF